MKPLLLLSLLLPINPGKTMAQTIHCPGENTVEMRYYAEQSWQKSDLQLRRKISTQLYKQWQDATRAVCSQAHGPYKDGTIYPQWVVGCDDHLNRALLKEFQPLGNEQRSCHGRQPQKPSVQPGPGALACR